MSTPCHSGADAAAYALGALDEHELAAFERHLLTCAICQEEVTSLQHLTNVLPLSAPQYAASKALRKRVIADVRADALRRAETTKRVTRSTAAERFAPTWGFLRGGAPPRPGIAGLAVAVVLVLVVVVVGLTAGGKARTASTAGTHVYQASIGKAEVVFSGNKAQLIVHGMRPLTKAQTYEVWYQSGSGKPQPTRALFDVSPSGDDAVTLPGNITGVTKVLVTREKAGGSAVPTSSPVVVARIS